MKRKEAIFRGLDLFPVYFDDTSTTSPDVFQITEFPVKLTAGKNLIKLKGHPSNLRIGSYLTIEVLDFNGDPIYSEIIDYIEEDKSRVIAIYVYEDTSPGDATVTIVGELKELNGQTIPTEWQGRTNVRWSRSVPVNPTLSNTTEIIFASEPVVTVTEQVNVQLDRVYVNNEQFPTYTTGSVRMFTLNGQPALEVTGGLFTKEMETGTVSVPIPVNPRPVPVFTPTSTTYTSTVKKVLNDTTLLLDSEFEVFNAQTFLTHTYTSFEFSPYTMSYEATPTYVPTQNSESFALVEIAGLEPATGDVNRILIYAQGKGNTGTWELVNDIELEAVELFVDTSSVFPDFKIGRFVSQSIIDTYWETHYYSGFTELTAPTLQWNTSSLSDGMQVIPAGGTALSARNQVITVQVSSSYAATFISESAYKVTIDAIATRNSITGTNNPKLSVYLSGSSFPFDATDILNQELPVRLGQRVGEVEITSDNQRLDDYVFEFTCKNSGTAVLILAIESGDWTFSDIRVETDNDAGYTPNYTRIRTEVPTKHKSRNQLSFKVEYYTVEGVKSDTVSYVRNKTWNGGNRYIDGDYSMLTGSLYVADSLESGIGISGYSNTGFIRSLGYSGFQQGDPGFLIWSGSALPGFNSKYNQPYDGVGLELYANTESYFRYSTSDNEIDVRTGTFFFGNNNTYVSGAGGNLQISSSDLNIYNGSITASDIVVIEQTALGPYIIFDTTLGIVDARNVGRQLVSDSTERSITGTAGTTLTTVASYPITLLPFETRLGISFSMLAERGNGTGTVQSHRVAFFLYTAVSGSGVVQFVTGSNAYYDAWTNSQQLVTFNGSDQYITTSTTSTIITRSLVRNPINGKYTFTIPSSHRGQYCLLEVQLQHLVTQSPGSIGSTTSTKLKNLSVISTREFAADYSNPDVSQGDIPPAGS